MGVTRIFVTANKSEADQTAGFWTHHPDGYTVHGFGPTSMVKVQNANPANTLWESSESTWYGVLVTKPDAPGAQAGGNGGGPAAAEDEPQDGDNADDETEGEEQE